MISTKASAVIGPTHTLHRVRSTFDVVLAYLIKEFLEFREWMMLSVTVQDLGDVTVLRCEGRNVAGQEADILRKAALAQVNRRTVVVDLTRVVGLVRLAPS